MDILGSGLCGLFKYGALAGVPMKGNGDYHCSERYSEGVSKFGSGLEDLQLITKTTRGGNSVAAPNPEREIVRN